MKKYVIAIIGLVAIVAAVGLVSAGYGPGAAERSQLNFVDEDGDGACDNMIDENNDGVCDNMIDEDGDGLPDRPMDGSGHQYKRGGMQGLGPRDGTGFGPGNGNCPYEE